MYVIRKWSPAYCDWRYYNTFETYGEAVEERERLERVYGGKFEIFPRQKGDKTNVQL